MPHRIAFVCLALAASTACGRTARQDYPVRPVPHSRVEITDRFWAPKIEVNRTASLPHILGEYEKRARYDSPRMIEAAAYMLARRRDPALERVADDLVEKAVAALQARLARPSPGIAVSGNFLEAAVAYADATGKRRMLDRAIQAADALDAAYGPGRKTHISGHEGLKIGLMSLYRSTGDERYWRLAKFFLDERGREDYPRQGEYAIDRTYAQDHLPVLQQQEAVGHAVRATYLYAPLTDVAALTGDARYAEAADRIWEDAVFRKTYVTGGIGSIRFHEQFGAPYELPALSAWNETCASYGYVLWNQRMFQLHQDARYVDLLERVLYNAFLAGVSTRGDRFFYQNPLTSYGNYDRFAWINTPCCPPNVVRLIASLGGYIYAQDTVSGDVFVNLFIGSTATLDVASVPVRLVQETRYPWDGKVTIRVEPQASSRFAISVRVPGWTGAQVLPGSLYTFADRGGDGRIPIRVNGEPADIRLVRGFARIDRRWSTGDVIELNIPMPVRRVLADPRVKDADRRVALARGPLVYAAEWPDNGGHALNVVVPDAAVLQSEFRADLLGGVEVVTSDVEALAAADAASPARLRPHRLVAIPYYAWANRGMGEMQVWLPRTAAIARPPVVVPPEPIARVTSSGGIVKAWTGYNDQNDDIAAVYDGVEPLHSADESHLYFRMRPPVGQAATIEYAFRSPTRLSSSEVYWADDRRFCRLPVGWRLLYKVDGGWKPVAARYAYSVEKDRFNRVEFEPVTTTAIRIEVEPQTRHYKTGEIGPPEAMFLDAPIDWREIGIIEWRVR